MLNHSMMVAGLLLAGTGAGFAKECRVVNAPPGVRVAIAPGCEPKAKAQPRRPGSVQAGRQTGFIDLGNGTQVRIGGRVQVDMHTRR